MEFHFSRCIHSNCHEAKRLIEFVILSEAKDLLFGFTHRALSSNKPQGCPILSLILRQGGVVDRDKFCNILPGFQHLFERIPLGHNLAVKEMNIPLGMPRKARIVRHHHNRRAVLVQVLQQLHHCFAVA